MFIIYGNISKLTNIMIVAMLISAQSLFAAHTFGDQLNSQRALKQELTSMGITNDWLDKLPYGLDLNRALDWLDEARAKKSQRDERDNKLKEMGYTHSDIMRVPKNLTLEEAIAELSLEQEKYQKTFAFMNEKKPQETREVQGSSNQENNISYKTKQLPLSDDISDDITVYFTVQIRSKNPEEKVDSRSYSYSISCKKTISLDDLKHTLEDFVKEKRQNLDFADSGSKLFYRGQAITNNEPLLTYLETAKARGEYLTFLIQLR